MRTALPAVPTPATPGRSLLFCFYSLLFIFLFYDIVFQGMSFSRRDILDFYFPMWYYAARSLNVGVLPFWNPFSNFGCPFIANVQNCVFYPPTVLLHLADFTW